SSYSPGWIPSWPRALEHAAELLSVGGSLQVVDFGQQERLPRWFRAALFGWIERFHVAPRADLERVLRGIAARRGAAMTFEPLYRGYAWSAALSRPTSSTFGEHV